jgi:hypothetical protein
MERADARRSRAHHLLGPVCQLKPHCGRVGRRASARQAAACWLAEQVTPQTTANTAHLRPRRHAAARAPVMPAWCTRRHAVHSSGGTLKLTTSTHSAGAPAATAAGGAGSFAAASSMLPARSRWLGAAAQAGTPAGTGAEGLLSSVSRRVPVGWTSCRPHVYGRWMHLGWMLAHVRICRERLFMARGACPRRSAPLFAGRPRDGITRHRRLRWFRARRRLPSSA